ncbi:acyl-CoA dehydrogenase family protein [Caballeronia sp. LZ016]|uniref:acyl-CoA dehydrogenase family protein n=1 Tax=Caballeronia sp. LZ016 TaxID=3038554 RepID=UPI002854EDC6|nr:acyl-CoA dehydrogenase family protein [Caballeronia sp. LZ016]MDR5739232.1 acyl-CoA dehydrogenase family protein [Caballeronia sp. LZ016]
MPFDRNAPLPADATVGAAWGVGPTDNYAALAARFRPIFARIREGSVAREVERRLPVDEIRWLREAGFTALRVPREYGGSGIRLVESFELLTELAEADSNIVQALRAHFGFVEHTLHSPLERRERWLGRLAEGAIVGGAWSETGEAPRSQFATRIAQEAGEWRLDGVKFYTTGSLFADWIHVGASDADEAQVSVTVDRRTAGVEVIDDWDGMGQRLTASGTSRFTNVKIDEREIVAGRVPFPYSEAFYQLVHIATLAGIGRAAVSDAAAAIAARKRSYSHAVTAHAAEDPQLLQVIGRARAHAWTTGAIVAQAARALERAAQSIERPDALAVIAEAEIEIWQAQTVASQLILDATASVFDALGASATLRTSGLDRYWRNARTLASHNPRIYKDRIVGDFAVNGTLPPGQWRIGVA